MSTINFLSWTSELRYISSAYVIHLSSNTAKETSQPHSHLNLSSPGSFIKIDILHHHYISIRPKIIYCASSSACKSTNSLYLPFNASSSWCVPDSTILPWSKTYIISAPCIVDNRCAIAIVVRFWAALSSASCTTLSDSESKALVASSNNNIFGLRMSARATKNY